MPESEYLIRFRMLLRSKDRPTGSSDVCGSWKMVRKVLNARPDGFQHLEAEQGDPPSFHK